jgi:hypothetical protein
LQYSSYLILTLHSNPHTSSSPFIFSFIHFQVSATTRSTSWLRKEVVLFQNQLISTKAVAILQALLWDAFIPTQDRTLPNVKKQEAPFTSLPVLKKSALDTETGARNSIQALSHGSGVNI